MGSCNTAQNEVGGKSLILKSCKSVTGIASHATGADITSTAHGLKVGDIVKFTALGGNTEINTTSFYYVKVITDADNFQVSATKSGSVIVLAHVSAAVEADFFTTIGGIRSKALNMKSKGIDITNQDSDEWMTMLDGAGERSMSISGSGVYSNETLLQSLYTQFLANQLACFMLIDTSFGRIYNGCFKITSMDISGDYNNEGKFSIAAESSGQVQTAVLA